MTPPAHGSPRDILVDETISAVRTVLNLQELSLTTTGRLRDVVGHGIDRAKLHILQTAWNSEPNQLRQALCNEVRVASAGNDLFGKPAESNLDAKLWTEWYPGLHNSHLKLGDVLEKLPGIDPDDVPKIVKLFENPSSPVALPGAVSLKRHDTIHLLLGRGLLDQDEAFVIGFTLGTNREATEDDIATLRAAFGIYPEPYQVREEDLRAFDLGVRAGRVSSVKDLAAIPVEEDSNLTIGEIRQKVGIDTNLLREFYRLEQQMIPGTPASARLAVL